MPANPAGMCNARHYRLDMFIAQPLAALASDIPGFAQYPLAGLQLANWLASSPEDFQDV
jgi:hypothetical protein